MLAKTFCIVFFVFFGVCVVESKRKPMFTRNAEKIEVNQGSIYCIDRLTKKGHSALHLKIKIDNWNSGAQSRIVGLPNRLLCHRVFHQI